MQRDASITFYTAISLTRGTTYKFKVAALNVVNDGPATATVSIIAAQAPGVPTDIVRLTNDAETSM